MPARLPAAVVGLVLVFAFGAVGCGDEEESVPQASGAAHIHGLGVNPSDGALVIATHAGLLRSPSDSSQAEFIGDSRQDMMGFTVIGPDRFLGSGHPAPGQSGPPHLGLVESADAGLSWDSVSLQGEADFHVLRASGSRVYGFNGLDRRLMVSSDAGRTWSRQRPPGEIIDLVIDPTDDDGVMASTSRGLALSEDGGASWKPVDRQVGLLAWPTGPRLYLIDGEGAVNLRTRNGKWSSVGSIGEAPVALTADGARTLFAALANGTVLVSSDGGSSWEERASI
jgi:hypothetical protein